MAQYISTSYTIHSETAEICGPFLMMVTPQFSKLTCTEQANVAKGMRVRYDLSGIHHTSIWGACVSPDPSNPTIAAATSRGICCIYLGVSSTDQQCTVEKEDDHSDVLAARWLSPFLLLGGCRSGLVELHDRRVRKKLNLLKHSSAATSIRSIDEHRVVVAGMNHQVSSTTIDRLCIKSRLNIVSAACL